MLAARCYHVTDTRTVTSDLNPMRAVDLCRWWDRLNRGRGGEGATGIAVVLCAYVWANVRNAADVQLLLLLLVLRGSFLISEDLWVEG